jgi:minor extracellular serine protease Vpr
MKRVSVLLLLVSAAFAQTRGRLAEFALVLEDPPVAQKAQSRAALQGAEAQAHLQKVRGAQRRVLAELAARKVRVGSTSQILVNAVFVWVAPEEIATLNNIPGVVGIQYLPPFKPLLNAAVNLVGVPAVWTAIGGSANAGAGVRIGIIDTGIDQNHPGFKDTGFSPPADFPAGDTGYTNNKVIVARSYVSMVQYPDLVYSSPDDLSPRDRQGHGTAIAMIAAGVQNTGPMGSITGVAPKAFLGNYKVFGSPGVNEYTRFPAWQQALTDAVNDGMDIVTLSLGEGDPAIFGPLDTGYAVCQDTGDCDVYSQAVESATRLGTLVVAAAGNGGNIGLHSVTKNSLNTPGVAPSAVTVGASANSHLVFQTVKVNGGSLGNLRGQLGDGPKIGSPLTAPVKDVTALGDDGLGCAALPAGSLAGAFALVQRGTCFFGDKVNFAQLAGAVGVIIYQTDGIDDVTTRMYLENTGIPAVMIGNSDGKALKAYLGTNPNATVTLDPAYGAADNSQVNTVAAFSSRGPSVGNFATFQDFALKPELVAPGTNVYTATQKFDPNSDTYNATGYTTVNGTSYAVPFVAGVAAMALAQNQNLKKLQPGQLKSEVPARLKSLVVNTASADLQGEIHVTDAGAGKLNAAAAVNAAATLDPAAISFGPVPTVLPVKRTLTLTNVSSAPATFSISVRPLSGDSNARVTVSPGSVSLAPGEKSSPITVSLAGSMPAAGSYEGFLDVKGAGPDLHLPYFYVVGSGVPYDIFPIQNGSPIGTPSPCADFRFYLCTMRLGFRVVDSYGVPVANLRPASFQIVAGGGKFDALGGDQITGKLGDAAVWIDMGPQQGDQIFTGTAGGLTQRFEGYARRLPVIKSGGVVNAAPPYQVGQGLAPGSYISIFGSDLADPTLVKSTQYLPLSLGQVSVSFDGGGKSVPGRFHFVSPGQINVQIPWEFQGDSSVQMKVTNYGYLWGDVYTVPLSTYSPGIFAVTDGVNNAVISAANPAKRGGSIVIYANGLGPVSTPQSSGEPASSTQLVYTSATPTVTLGGGPTGPIFSGLTPGIVGLYQVNVSVPSGASTGTQPLRLSIGGQDVTVNVVVQ